MDNQSPFSSDAGPGTETHPYRTIASAVIAHPGPGTTILVKPGVYRESVNITTSGGSSSPYVIRAVGEPPVLDGTDDFSSPGMWTQYADDVWLASAVSWNPAQVFLAGGRLLASSVAPGQLPAGSFRWIAGLGLFVNTGGGNPGGQDLAVGRRLYGFHMSRRSHVAIEGFTVVRSELYGIDIADSSTDVMVSRDSVRFSGEYGMRFAGGSGHLVEGNVVSDNGNHGIVLNAKVTGCVIRDNECFRNADPETRVANGIYLFNAPANTLYRNRLHDNQDSGMHFQSGSNDCVSFNNVSWNNGDHGFDHLFATGTTHSSDVAYGNYRDGFSIEGSSPGTHVYNCVSVENGLTTNGSDLWVDVNSTSDFESDRNIFWNSTSQPPVKYVATRYPTVAAYSAVSGEDENTIQADPRFENPVAGEFHLLADSPAIDSGDSGAPGWPPQDAEGRARRDDQAIPDTGVGPLGYADRGAFEYDLSDMPPEVTAPASVSGMEGQPLVVNVTATDPDGDAILSLYPLGLPAGATFAPGPGDTTGGLIWTPALGKAGDYVVAFRARNALIGSATTTISIAAAPVNQPPVPVLLLSATAGTEPLQVDADASGSSDPDGAIASYRFDFGDGTVVGPQALPSATHVFAAGTWTVMLTVKDDTGASTSRSDTVRVAEVQGLANLAGNPSFEVNTAGWNSYSGAGLVRVPGGHDGTFSLQLAGLSGSTASFGVNDSPNWISRTGTPGRRYRFSAWVRSAAAHGTCKLRVREYQGPTRLGGLYSSGTVLSGEWQLLSLDYVAAGSGSTLDFQVVNFPNAEGEIFLVDDIAIRNVSGGPNGSGGPEAGGPLQARVSPLPARSHSILSFVVSRPGPLSVELYDATGRRARVLLHESSAPAGLYELPVGGQGPDGLLRPGVYFFLIRAAEGVVSGRLVFLK